MAPQTVDANYARTVAAVLLAFLDSLPEPVVPLSLHQRCAEVTSRDVAFEMLSLFPPTSVNAWICVTAFLHLLTLKEKDPLSPEDTQPSRSPSRTELLASIFTPILFRDNSDNVSLPPVSPLGKKRFLLLFMEGP
ncbi:hypothetical protein B0F90DRAFT_1156163 [Multifurca ochricompacta]|uniref:Rho-GAP domain-containing protein n=1 Tax=Multifurca ochricompacta TaxID=376703 RepID=A0AAD4M7B9_9AGAM|nr:hypothetical protein B0F90DRAFT_1156163 [Multifurca ochricompacta]